MLGLQPQQKQTLLLVTNACGLACAESGTLTSAVTKRQRDHDNINMIQYAPISSLQWVFKRLHNCKAELGQHTHNVSDSASITPKPNHPQHIVAELLFWQQPNVQPTFPSCSANDFMLPLRPWPRVGSTWPTRVPGWFFLQKPNSPGPTGWLHDFMFKQLSLGDHLRFRGCNKNDLNQAKWDTLV